MPQLAGRTRRTLNSAKNSLIQRRHKPDYQIILFVGLLMLLGLIIMYAIGPQRAHVLNNAHGTDFYTGSYFVIKQTISLLLALAAFVFMAFLPFATLLKLRTPILVTGLVACLLLLFFGNLLKIESIAQCSLGACRWFELGPLGSFQPAELLKFGVLVFTAGFLGMRIKQGEINNIERTVFPIAVVGLVSLFFTVFVQKDMGTGIALVSILVTMFMIGGINMKIGFKLLGVLLAFGVLAILVAPHRMERVMTFLDGDSSSSAVADDANYHIQHAKIAIGTGGLFGVGIGNSVQATGYLPEAINDSVFAIMGETFGFVGLVVILLLFTALLIRLLKITDHLLDPSMQIFVGGAFGWLGSHVILNIASMIGVFPLTGITLPLLSFGGTSMLFIAAALGMAFQLSRYTSHGSTNKEARYENIGSRRRVGRTRNASSRSITRA